MPMSRSVITNTGVCRRSARSSDCAGELEALVGILREQQHVLGVAVRGVGAGEQVGLLGARGHAGGRAAALHVDDGRRDLGEVGQADELGHQRHARAGGGGEGARAVPGRADHHADRGQFVFGLDDRVALLAGVRVDAQLRAQYFWNASTTDEDGVIGYQAQTRGAAVDAAQRGRGVAVDEDAVADRVGALARAARSARAAPRHGEPVAERVEVRRRAASPCPCTARRTASRSRPARCRSARRARRRT